MFEKEYAEFETAMRNYMESVLPRCRDLLDKGYCITGSIQRRAGKDEIRVELASHVMVIAAPGEICMKQHPDTLQDFALALCKRVTAMLELPYQLRLKASKVAAMNGYQVMNWFILPEPDASSAPAVEPEECPKSLH